MERTCQAQLLAEAATANGIKKNIISDVDVQYTADALTEPVLHILNYSADCQESLYFDFQTEYNLLPEETGGTFLRDDGQSQRNARYGRYGCTLEVKAQSKHH